MINYFANASQKKTLIANIRPLAALDYYWVTSTTQKLKTVATAPSAEYTFITGQNEREETTQNTTVTKSGVGIAPNEQLFADQDSPRWRCFPGLT
jgi:hypothetical protein